MSTRIIQPILTIDGSFVSKVEKGVQVELVYSDGVARQGVVEQGDHPDVIKLAIPDKGYRSYTRKNIRQFAFVL